MMRKHKPSLPNELLREIFSVVRSRKDLLNIRLANLRFCSLVNSYAFRTVYVHDTPESIRRLYAILLSPHIAKEIKELYVIQENFEVEIAPHEMNGKQDSLIVALMELRRASSLTSLNIIFGASAITFTPHTSIICALTAGIPSSALTSLSLTVECLPVDSDAFKTQAFVSKISALTRLSIRTSGLAGHSCGFWNHIVSPHFLQPGMGTLTSLALETNWPTVDPTIPFPSLFFPRLSHLSLKMFVFEPVNDLEDFIIRHGATLTHLYLDQCPAVSKTFDDAPPDHPFHPLSEIWNHFSQKLGMLTVIEIRYQNVRLGPFYYLARGWPFTRDDRVHTPDRLREDDVALEVLRSVVDTRRRGFRTQMS